MSAASNDIQWRCLGLPRSMVGLTTRFPQRLAKQFSLHDPQVAAKDTHQGRFWRRRLGPFGITIERLRLVCLPVAIACTECRGKENIDNTTLVAPRFFIMIRCYLLNFWLAVLKLDWPQMTPVCTSCTCIQLARTSTNTDLCVHDVADICRTMFL